MRCLVVLISSTPLVSSDSLVVAACDPPASAAGAPSAGMVDSVRRNLLLAMPR